MGKIERSQLCCSIEEGGAKMIDVKHLTVLKLKGFLISFNKNYVADWKTTKNIFLKDNLLFCVLRSNCKFNGMIKNNLAILLRFSKSTLKTSKCILGIAENIATETKFLWLKKFVKY